MKALSFIQLYKLAVKAFKKYKALIFRLLGIEVSDYNWWDLWAKFLSQPFKPEMIVELFEGWSEEKHEETEQWASEFIIYRNKTTKIEYSKCYWFYNVLFNDVLYSYRHKPRTLDDFINDCQKIGIELEWREK